MIFAGIVAVLLAMPMMPQSFWERMDSITNAETDPTGSRAARIRLIEQAVTVFSDNPITGIGAGQFVNYDGPDALERNRATHDVWLQVAAELGIFGLFTFAFLVFRSYKSCFMTMRALRTPKKKAGKARGVAAPLRPRALDRTAFRSTKTKAAAAPSAVQPLTEEEARIVEINAKGMLAAMVGWTVCSLFASVAFNWTFYYVFALAVAGREIALSRRRAVEAVDATAQPVVGVPRLAASRA
jgi:hypothetical protein